MQPGPLRAFYERLRARRGHGKAIVATARKLAVLFWCLLTRGEDYAHQQPSLTTKKLRRLEITAGAPTPRASRPASGAPRERMRQAERELAQQAEASYKRMVATGKQPGPPAARKGGRERDSGARIDQGPRRATSRGRPRAPDVCASTRPRLAPTRSLTLHRRRRHAASRRRQRAAENRPNHADRPPPGPNRGHRSRSKALRDPPATDPTPEIEPEIASAVARIGREPSIRVTSDEPYVSWRPPSRSPESPRQHVYATAALVVVLTSRARTHLSEYCPQRSRVGMISARS